MTPMWTRERISVCAYFAILGIVCSAWASSLDELKLILGLDERQLGWLLFFGPLGNLLSFFFASSLVDRLGARRCVIIATTAYLLSVAALIVCFITIAPLVFWRIAIACFGATGNIVNISMNTQAGVVEKRSGRQIMSSFHGVFSLLMFASAVFTLLTSSLQISVATRLIVTVCAAVLIHVVFCPGLPREERRPSEPDPVTKRFHRPDRSLVALGLAALVIMGCEASICDWVCVFFREALSVTDSQAKWGFCAVTGMMALARLAGDGFVNRFSAKRVLHADCMLVSFGLLVALMAPYVAMPVFGRLILSTAGYAVSGFGIAGMIPILYSKVNRTKVMPPASALTFVGSMGFFGYFFGPPLIGYVAKATNLSLALGIFGILILSCLVLDPGGDASWTEQEV